MNEKVPPTASNRRKRELAREGDLVTYKRKRKIIDPSIVVPPNTVDSANEGVSVNIPTESAEGVNIPQGSEFETESAQASLGAQPPLPNKLKSHYAYKLEKVLSDGTVATAKKKNGLTARSVARPYILYVLGSFLFPIKKGTDVSTRYLVLFAKDKVANKWSWGSVVLAHTYYNLGATSRDDARQFTCYTTLLESWIFAHFPKLGGIPKEMDSDAYDQKWKEFALKKADRGRRVRERPLVCTEAYFEWFASVLWTTIYPITVDLAVDDSRIHQRNPASVNKNGDTPVHQSEDITEQYDASHHEHSSRSPNISLNDQQITTLNDQLQKLKDNKEKESEANINLREPLKEKTSECDLLKETIEQIKAKIELKRVVDEQCPLEFADLPRQLDAKILEYKNLKKKNTSLEAELRQKSGLEDYNQSLSVELNKKHKKLVNSEEKKKTLEVDNNEWEVWHQALKKALASEGMGDMGDPTFEELFEQDEILFTIAQQRPKGDFQEYLVSTAVTLENVFIARREKMAKKKKMQELLFQP
ncbi:hypothetical protein GIB67_035391 [Kingdonia uniflora]|uniref:Aminotransferase-like plant mobile domain-containing protein n=1 Tax=Kingdonia uniflora TaxID=39325 RepID=A0A7J7MMK6_9MAGN|nr:hypothetical protein GIB67_035391 [Kingdonia uniflora]